MAKAKKPTVSIAASTLSRIEKVMRKNVSKRTNAIKLTQYEIAEKSNVSIRTVNRAFTALKANKVIKNTDNGYTFV